MTVEYLWNKTYLGQYINETKHSEVEQVFIDQSNIGVS